MRMTKVQVVMLIVGLTLVIFASYAAITVANRAKAKITMIHMRRLEALLLVARPAEISKAYLRGLLAPHGQEGYVLDGWGRPIEVSVEVDALSRSHYRLVSLGRDGRRGACCNRFVGFDWDADAVLEDQHWLQVWR
jgi:hypothetical protein